MFGSYAAVLHRLGQRSECHPRLTTIRRCKDAGVNRRKAGAAFIAGVLLLAALVVGRSFALKHFARDTPHGRDFAIWDDPKRTLSLANDTEGPRLMRRCESVDECRSSDDGELVQPRESFDFKLYYDEGRTYVVTNLRGKTFGCITVPVANGVGPSPDSLSDLVRCPPRTAESGN